MKPLQQASAPVPLQPVPDAVVRHYKEGIAAAAATVPPIATVEYQEWEPASGRYYPMQRRNHYSLDEAYQHYLALVRRPLKCRRGGALVASAKLHLNISTDPVVCTLDGQGFDVRDQPQRGYAFLCYDLYPGYAHDLLTLCKECPDCRTDTDVPE